LISHLSGAVPNSYLLTAAASTPTQFDPGLPAALLAQLTAGVPPQVGYLSLDVGTTSAENVKTITVGAVNVSGRVVFGGKPVGENPNLAKINIGLVRDPDLIAVPDALLPLPPPQGTPTGSRQGNGQVATNGTFNLNMAVAIFA